MNPKIVPLGMLAILAAITILGSCQSTKNFQKTHYQEIRDTSPFKTQ